MSQERDPMMEAFKAMNNPTPEVVEETVDVVEDTPIAEEEPKAEVETPVVEETISTKEEIVEEQPKQPLETKKEYEYKNPHSKELDEAIRSRDLSKAKEILDKAFYDASRLSKDEAVVAYLKQTNPNLSDDELNDMLFDDYAVGKKPLTDEARELMTEAEIAAYEKELRSGNRNYNKLYNEAVGYLNANNKIEVELPEWEQPEFKAPEGYMTHEEWVATATKETEEFVKKASQDFENDMATYSKSKTYTVNLGTAESKDDFQVKYELTDKDFGKLYQRVADMASGEYFKQFQKADGSFDFKAVADDLLYNDLTEKILTSSLKEIRAVSKKDVIKNEIKNYKSPTETGGVTQSDSGDYLVNLMKFR